MLSKLQQWFASFAQSFGPWGIFLIALGDSAFLPMPQGVDALLIAQAIAVPSSAYFAAALAVLGSLVGSLILYGMAKTGGRRLLEKKVSPKTAEGLRRQIEQYGAFVLLLPTMLPLPLPMKLFVIAAGVFQMKLAHFIAVLVFARSVRYFGEAFLAVRMGEQTTVWLKENALLGLGIALAIIAVFFLVHRWSNRRLSEG